MKKRIVICADGTWNKPEEDPSKDFPTNVLKLARAIKPVAKSGQLLVPQQVFYDWGIGSYHDGFVAGATGRGLHKNIMDDYRYIVQNYSPGDEIFLFGFSRGSYTIRSLCGLINNCGIIKRPDAALIQEAFNLYKKSGADYAPRGVKAIAFRERHSHPSREIAFVGVWDTVGAMGIPVSFLGLFEDKDEFYDTKIGSNIRIARHAMAIDENRSDFEPTVWQPQANMDMQQVWFAGAHSNVGGSYKPDKDGSLLSDTPLLWMLQEAARAGLEVEPHIKANASPNPNATLHNSRRSFYRVKKTYWREIDHGLDKVLIHSSVKQRWLANEKYRPKNLQAYLDKHGWPQQLIT
ncbi:DUF2235 domain-containing protein [Dasania sp. GY-MA-18]|uniref:DUF2235 domain-containing protein n=1 Tax=Dasania phycosphaerae TaxID=2950436 RepID=A0A9J6RSC3_9GAMM|nr:MULTISPECIES: DUF2235 domain-containing protein [Dasania]MCR8924328.1 DUF2235 domain-containing protein [Dasania sp. GY-MA-18]MCZ0866981.1 DUF2235 domain-containing protein [Dasania phycosphaerae]MCZ0870485.1 DUF2235 domain-containing protein [Dasania phycosphaerae]